MRTAKYFLLSFLSAALFAALICFAPLQETAYADHISGTYAFAYNGETHEIVPNEDYDESLTYLWYKDGSETPTESFVLSVRNVVDGGRYRRTVTDGENVILEEETLVTVTPRQVGILWRTGAKSNSPVYNAEDPFVYNGNPQSIYPYPINLVSGEKLSVTAIGNTATNAGEYLARALTLIGGNGTDEKNYALSDERFSYRILPAPLHATVRDVTLPFGDVFLSAEIDWTGLFGDAPAETYVTDYEAGSPIGEYPFGITIDDPNYALTVTSGTLTVCPRPVTVIYENGQSIYGDATTFAYRTEGTVDGFFPEIVSVLPSSDAGVYEILGSCPDENYDVTFLPASYEIMPRKVSLRVNAAETHYGDPIGFSVTFTSGSLATGETQDALQIALPLDRPNAGTYTVYPQSKNENYDAEIEPCRVVVSPRPITVTLFGAMSLYGDKIVTPAFDIDEDFAYDDHESDVGFYPIKEPGIAAGIYQLSGACTNPNYTPVIKAAKYIISPRTLSVTVYIPRTPVWKGEPLSFPYEASEPVGSDRVAFRVLYARINDRGTAEEGRETIDEPGEYALILDADKTGANRNYNIGFSPVTQKEFTVFSEELAYNGVKIFFENGYDDHVSVLVENLAIEPYEKLVFEQISLQDPLLALRISIEEPTSPKMRVSVPVPNDKLHYSAAIINDGKVSYAPCLTENGYAVFTVSATDKTIVLMADRDGTPFLVVAVILLVFILVELIVLYGFLKKYRRKKSCAFAFLPLLGANTGTALGGIYAFVLAGAIEAVVAVGLLIAILVLAKKINRIGKAKK